MSAQLEPRHAHSDDHWIPLSDLMTGLMMLFLLVAIAYMIKVEADKKLIEKANAQIEERSARIETQSKKMKEIAVVYESLKSELYNDFLRAFERDLSRWGAELDRDGPTVRFKEPSVLFSSGSADLKPEFKRILSEFFPRYLDILYSNKYRSIQEVRIEGHTSSFWLGAPSEQQGYFLNMKLSQDRTRSTLEYVMGLEADLGRLQWLRDEVTANGLSYAKRILRSDGKEDVARSQRVEFRVRTNSDARIGRIIEAAQ